MKKIVALALGIVLLLAVLVSCGYQRADTPQKLLANYEKAYNNRDKEMMRKCATPEFRAQMTDENLDSYLSGNDKVSFRITQVEYSDDGNSARVYAEISITSPEGQHSGSEVFYVDKIDGLWYLEEY